MCVVTNNAVFKLQVSSDAQSNMLKLAGDYGQPVCAERVRVEPAAKNYAVSDVSVGGHAGPLLRLSSSSAT